MKVEYSLFGKDGDTIVFTFLPEDRRDKLVLKDLDHSTMVWCGKGHKGEGVEWFEFRFRIVPFL